MQQRVAQIIVNIFCTIFNYILDIKFNFLLIRQKLDIALNQIFLQIISSFLYNYIVDFRIEILNLSNYYIFFDIFNKKYNKLNFL